MEAASCFLLPGFCQCWSVLGLLVTPGGRALWGSLCACSAIACLLIIWTYFQPPSQEVRLERKKQCEEAADKLLRGTVKLVTTKDSEKIIADIMNFKRDNIRSKVGGPGGDEIPNVVILNWTAPCMVPVSMQTSQLGVLSWALQDCMQSVAAVLNPIYTYTKGKLHLEEAKMLSMLGQGNHNLDMGFGMCFTDPQDSRDDRPLLYSGRLVLPSPVPLHKHIFYNCELRRARRTADVKQVLSNNLKFIEDPASCVPSVSESECQFWLRRLASKLSSSSLLLLLLLCLCLLLLLSHSQEEEEGEDDDEEEEGEEDKLRGPARPQRVTARPWGVWSSSGPPVEEEEEEEGEEDIGECRKMHSPIWRRGRIGEG